MDCIHLETNDIFLSLDFPSSKADRFLFQGFVASAKNDLENGSLVQEIRYHHGGILSIRFPLFILRGLQCALAFWEITQPVEHQRPTTKRRIRNLQRGWQNHR